MPTRPHRVANTPTKSRGVRLTDAETATLDRHRGPMSRSEVIVWALEDWQATATMPAILQRLATVGTLRDEDDRYLIVVSLDGDDAICAVVPPDVMTPPPSVPECMAYDREMREEFRVGNRIEVLKAKT